MFKVRELIAKQKAKSLLHAALRNAEIGSYYRNGKINEFVYPKVLNVSMKPDKLTYVFAIPNGLDPEEVRNKAYVFRQAFGKNISLKGEDKRFILTVYVNSLPSKLAYDYEKIKPQLDKSFKIPIICGLNLENELVAFDLAKVAHFLLSGETGSGKSSLLHVILCTLIQHVSPENIRLYLCDLKRSELGIYRNVEHVETVQTTAKGFMPFLTKLKKEMQRRGDLLDKNAVNHVSKLKKRLPNIVVCIDEFALMKKEEEALEIIEEISCVGRALGIHLILAIQRPDSKAFSGTLKNNLKVRISGRHSDAINARIADTPGAEEIGIYEAGRMLVKLDELTLIQAPYLDEDDAKRLLEGYKSIEPTEPVKDESEASDDVSETVEDDELTESPESTELNENNVFGVLHYEKA